MDTLKTELARVPETPVDLATSFLKHHDAGLRKEIDRLREDIQFEETYQPRIGGYSSAEPGSMDASDQLLSQLEADQVEFERDDNIGDLEARIQEEEDKLEMNVLMREAIKNGDTNIIDYYADKETERREKLEEQKRKREASTSSAK